MAGEDPSEIDELNRMLIRAEEYVRSFSWCPIITERYMGVGVVGVVALFLFRFDRPISGNDYWLWVIEGDLPSAYFVIDQARDAASALEVYCQLMDDWADSVMNQRSLEDVFPVSVSPTVEHANMLQSRVKFIREQIIPMVN